MQTTPDCPCDLDGLRVLVTRPKEQADLLAEAIINCGGRVELLPLLAIEPALDEADRGKLQQAADYDDLLFVSPNAVRHAAGLFKPDEARVIAIGEATAALLEQNGIRVAIVPQRSTSEALLLDGRLGPMTGRNVLIVRGRGGRELLAGSLREAGASVDYAEVYRRCTPPSPPADLMQAWNARVDVMIVTSEQMLKNLVTLTHNDRNVLGTPLVVISERLQNAAGALGFTDTLQADNPYPADLLRALCHVAGRKTGIAE